MQRDFQGANDSAQLNANLSYKLQRALDGENHMFLEESRAVAADYAAIVDGISREDHRELTKNRVVALAENGYSQMAFPVEYGGLDEGEKYLLFVELLSHGDMSTVIKQGVNYGLFGTSVLNLGTEKHHAAYLNDIMNARLLGGFAMTEMGGGSNVQGLQTTATYDRQTDSFVIDTPNDAAKKAYIGNAALHGEMMVVFAQLKMDESDESKGVHAFLVPVRDRDTKTLLPGIAVEDHGEKVGLNGIDNGTITFDKVSVPRDAMLDRFATIDATDGTYKSDIESATARFFKMIGTLVTGRTFLSLSSLSAVKSALTHSIHAASRREVFGSNLLDLQATQEALITPLAESYALHFATRELITKTQEEKGSQELETLAALLKARASEFAFKTIDAGRTKAGGEGYLAQYHYGTRREDVDIYRTFEGDNTVLKLFVARNILTSVKKEFADRSNLGKFAAGLSIKFNQAAARFGADRRRTSDKNLTDLNFFERVLRKREELMKYDLSSHVLEDYKETGEPRQAFDNHQLYAIDLAEAHADSVSFSSFKRAIKKQDDPEVVESLEKLAQLYAITKITENAGWYLEKGVLVPKQTARLRSIANRLKAELKDSAVTYVDAFAVPENMQAPLPPSNLDPQPGGLHPQ